MRGANDDEPRNLVRIILHSLWPSGTHPVRMLGGFEARSLSTPRCPSMGLEWTRAADQTCEEFEASIVEAILEMRGLPSIDGADMRGRRGAIPSRGLASIS